MDKLSERLDDLEARVAALEELCALMNEEITSMQTVISALEEGLYITDVREVGDEYVTFTLADGTSFQIPLEKPLDIIFDVEDMEETVLTSFADLEIKYTIQSSAADISIEVITEGDIKATLNRTDELNGVITVCADDLESVEVKAARLLSWSEMSAVLSCAPLLLRT